FLAAAAVAQQLPEVRQRLQEERAAAHRLAGREANVLGRLADLERQIEVESRGLRAAEARLRAATQRLSTAEEGAARAQAELEVATTVVEPRLVARYRLGREGYVRFLLGSTSIADLLRRSRVAWRCASVAPSIRASEPSPCRMESTCARRWEARFAPSGTARWRMRAGSGDSGTSSSSTTATACSR